MKYRYIGKIVSTRGLKGEVKVLSDTDFQEERYGKKRAVYIKKEDQMIPLFVRSYKVLKGVDLLVFEGYEDINLVESLVGLELYSEDLPIKNKRDNEYHVDELIGLKVYQGNEEQGVVKEIKTYPQGDYLLILKKDQSTALIPFRDEFVTSLDLEKRCLEIALIEGLL
ncbi:MAG: ribosome maturation factor RimM [Candidatus Izemoplasmatales bacterium]